LSERLMTVARSLRLAMGWLGPTPCCRCRSPRRMPRHRRRRRTPSRRPHSMVTSPCRRSSGAEALGPIWGPAWWIWGKPGGDLGEGIACSALLDACVSLPPRQVNRWRPQPNSAVRSHPIHHRSTSQDEVPEQFKSPCPNPDAPCDTHTLMS